MPALKLRGAALALGSLALALGAAEPGWSAPLVSPVDAPIVAPVETQVVAALGEVSTEHELQLHGHSLRYRASFDEQGLGPAAQPQASISAVSYVRLPQALQRPLLFVFNGGPGASSSPLHFGGLGPYLQETGADGRRVLVPNPDSLLDAADLVFIDPPGTGMSQAPRSAAERLQYWSTQGDASAVRDYISAWLRRHGRAASPVYIAGESYGGFRLASMAAQLGDIHPAGLLLISPLLDASASAEAPGNDWPYIFGLPSLAVAAVHHGLVPAKGRTAEQVFAQARQFAQGEYALALLKGAALPAPERARMARRLAGLIGLSAAQIEAADLRVDAEAYRTTVLASRGQVIGRLDSRVLAPVPKSLAGRPSAASDPALGLGASNVIVSSLIGRYLREQLQVPLQRDYVSLSLDINFQWQYGASPAQTQVQAQSQSASPFYSNPSVHLADRLRENPQLRLLVLTGYYDLAVPALAPYYALTHVGVAPQRMRFELRPSGHSVFAEPSERRALHALLSEFLR